MLDPHDRHVYLDALKPPDGYEFGEAVATTYSLDLTTLLCIPVALVLPHLDVRRLDTEHALDLLQALRQVSSRLTVFCNQGCITPPSPGVLYGMLEKVVVPARAPHGGSLHAKMWLIRFDPTSEEGGEPRMRFVALSRNLTNDHSWDVSAVLESTTGRAKGNGPIVDLLEALPDLALKPMEGAARERIARLAAQAAKIAWERPQGFTDLAFHVLGLGKKPKAWLPEYSDKLVVVSPFVSAAALAALQEATKTPVALISRGNELDACDQETLGGFETVYVLADAAAQEDGEDTSETPAKTQPRGLHAKAYVAKRGWDTHLYLGSANATNSGLRGQNIELLVELSGKSSGVPGKGLDSLFDRNGLGSILERYQPPAEEPAIDAAAEMAEQALSQAVVRLAQAKLSLRFEHRGDEYLPFLHAPARIELPGVSDCWAWLVSSDMSSARQAHGLTLGEPVQLASCASATATAFVAFDLHAEETPARKQFVLNLPVEGMPSDREAHIVRVVVKNKDRLLQYILGLLQGVDPFVRAGLEGTRPDASFALAGGLLAAGIMEHLVRAKARHPERLDEVRSVLEALNGTAEGRAMIPDDLLQLWTTVSGEELR